MPRRPEFEELIQVDIDEATDTSSGRPSDIVVYNDDFNTFDWVIECFQEILGHTATQAEQLAIMIHFKGKAKVKSGPHKELRPKKDALVDRGLSAVIENG